MLQTFKAQLDSPALAVQKDHTAEEPHISVELVARDKNSFEQSLATIKQHFPEVKTINIPDLLRYDMRSVDASYLAKLHGFSAIPHIRAIDHDVHLKDSRLIADIEENEIDKVLVVSGDIVSNSDYPMFQASALDIIGQLKKDLPQLDVYAALDPYRQSFQEEYQYALRKLEAGASGLFTQPFFDLRLLEVYMELYQGIEVYWGFSSVVGQASESYWRSRNRAIFPQNFEASIEWNCAFARAGLEHCQAKKQHCYFMPVKTKVLDYLVPVFAEF